MTDSTRVTFAGYLAAVEPVLELRAHRPMGTQD